MLHFRLIVYMIWGMSLISFFYWEVSTCYFKNQSYRKEQSESKWERKRAISSLQSNLFIHPPNQKDIFLAYLRRREKIKRREREKVGEREFHAHPISEQTLASISLKKWNLEFFNEEAGFYFFASKRLGHDDFKMIWRIFKGECSNHYQYLAPDLGT